jgi:hypothetical protein
MWDKQDTFTRWLQGILAVVIFFVSVFLIALEIRYLSSSGYSSFGDRNLLGVLGFGGFYVSFRCLWYAITGEDNINREDS